MHISKSVNSYITCRYITTILLLFSSIYRIHTCAHIVSVKLNLQENTPKYSPQIIKCMYCFTYISCAVETQCKKMVVVFGGCFCLVTYKTKQSIIYCTIQQNACNSICVSDLGKIIITNIKNNNTNIIKMVGLVKTTSE